MNKRILGFIPRVNCLVILNIDSQGDRVGKTIKTQKQILKYLNVDDYLVKMEKVFKSYCLPVRK